MGGSLSVSGQTVINSGAIHADGVGGTIAIQAASFQNSGRITADGTGGAGGTVRVAFTGSYVETTSGLIAADGAGGAGGRVTIDGGTSGHLFTSGRQEARGTTGGSVGLLAGTIDVIGGSEDASGSAGAGGHVSVIAKGNEQYFGSLAARGVTAGGVIEASAGETLTYGGSADAGASAGPAGSLKLDPANLVISNAPTGVLPQYDLPDPDPGDGDTFGATTHVLGNGNVVVTTQNLYGGVSQALGAVYLFNARTGALISSLIGTNSGDQVGIGGVTVLPDGNFLISSPAWNGGEGAVTWGSATSGVNGTTISAGNSLVGSHAGDAIGATVIDYGGGNVQYLSNIEILNDGNYVVLSPSWNGGEGAVTWGSESTGVSGTVAASNSLVGSTASDGTSFEVDALSNGNYVVVNPSWNGGYGAVTWGSGTAGVKGTISASNSLIGATANDHVGGGYATLANGYSVGGSVTVLSNGNYVVASPLWNNQTGAVTWGSGTAGVKGTISASNSLLGSGGGDLVGARTDDGAGDVYPGIRALGNGNYVVASPFWGGGKGEVTWESGGSAATGTVSSSNSLIGSSTTDEVGLGGVTALTNGNYVVASPYWSGNEGAVTWESGTAAAVGTVSTGNSLVGTAAGDEIGFGGVTALTNGNYVVASFVWHGEKGAVTWGSGTTGIVGAVSTSNSIVGSVDGYEVGYFGPGESSVTALPDGNFVIASPNWNYNAAR